MRLKKDEGKRSRLEKLLRPPVIAGIAVTVFAAVLVAMVLWGEIITKYFYAGLIALVVTALVVLACYAVISESKK